MKKGRTTVDQCFYLSFNECPWTVFFFGAQKFASFGISSLSSHLSRVVSASINDKIFAWNCILTCQHWKKFLALISLSIFWFTWKWRNWRAFDFLSSSFAYIRNHWFRTLSPLYRDHLFGGFMAFPNTV